MLLPVLILRNFQCHRPFKVALFTEMWTYIQVARLSMSCCGADRYKDYVKHLVTRVNTINGRKYSEDSTIFGVLPAPPCECSALCCVFRVLPVAC